MVLRVATRRHTSLRAWLRCLVALPWTGTLDRTVRINSDPRDVEGGWDDAEGKPSRGKPSRCVGDASKLIGRTFGLRTPRAGSVRFALRAERAQGVMTGRWEILLLTHEGAGRLKPNAHHVRRFHVAVKPGEPFTVRLRGKRGSAPETDRTLATVKTAAGDTALLTLYRPLTWGVPLSPYVGGDCSASSTLRIEVTNQPAPP